MSAPTSRQWILKPAAQDGRKHACCRKAVDARQVIAKTRDSLSNWVGTFTYEDSALYAGRILSFDHSDISKIINDIRRNHSESFLSSKTGLTYKPSLSNIRLVCNHGRDADVTSLNFVSEKLEGNSQILRMTAVRVALIWFGSRFVQVCMLGASARSIHHTKTISHASTKKRSGKLSAPKLLMQT